MKPTPLKPYLIRAIYEWVVDHDLTPHLVVNAEGKGVDVPLDFVQDGKIVLNLRPAAVQGLSLGNDQIEFNARFGGRPMHVSFPVAAVVGVYAKENGIGMVFEEGGDGDDQPPAPDGGGRPDKPVLKVVK